MSVFGRKIQARLVSPSTGVELDTSEDTQLNVTFNISRTLDLEPSLGSVTIHNLSRDKQQLLVEVNQEWKLEVFAGYGDDVPLIFSGDVNTVRNRREPPLIITDVEAADGGNAFAVEIKEKHFPPGSTTLSVFRWLQQQSGLGGGPAFLRIRDIRRDDGLPDRLKSGTTIRGFVMEELNDLARSRGAIVSVQDGELVSLRPGEALEDATETEISAATGMIGYPSVDSEGKILVTHRLLPGLTPGNVLTVASDFVSGQFVIERCDYYGGLYEDDFNVEIEGQQIGERAAA